MMEQIHCSSYVGLFHTKNEWVSQLCIHRRHCRWQGYTVNEEDVSHTHTLGLAQLLHTITKNTNTYKILGVYRHATQRPIQIPKTYDIIFFFFATQCSVFSSISNVEQISSQRMCVCFFLFFSTLYTFLITSRSRMAYISLMVEQKFNQHTAIRKKIFLIFPQSITCNLTKCRKFNTNIICRRFVLFQYDSNKILQASVPFWFYFIII